ncbi:MAG: hypothetical protein IKF77_04890 [Thermoguttaceae bacterium]|nr:hypothetical protein [Thermoguttaceae bacterium]MBQ3332633.1 hypothetical protein [Thermoguttaceae bacterium]MBQ3454492.1 hypothetical protein [Thermoguttaceae bacterium]MBQ6618888.1 hypothetical protein [Thermoguttaceae bacterium]MBR2584676.1 hypothetical protein [Thermoguttaceae bacterium]
MSEPFCENTAAAQFTTKQEITAIKKSVKRRGVDPTTSDRVYSRDELEFMNALNLYKQRSGRMFPTCSEILEVLRSLGYTKSA